MEYKAVKPHVVEDCNFLQAKCCKVIMNSVKEKMDPPSEASLWAVLESNWKDLSRLLKRICDQYPYDFVKFQHRCWYCNRKFNSERELNIHNRHHRNGDLCVRF